MTWFQMKLITSSNLEGLLENPISSFEYDGLKLSRNFYRTTFISFFPAGTVGFSFPLSQFPIGIQSSLFSGKRKRIWSHDSNKSWIGFQSTLLGRDKIVTLSNLFTFLGCFVKILDLNGWFEGFILIRVGKKRIVRRKFKKPLIKALLQKIIN